MRETHHRNNAAEWLIVVVFYPIHLFQRLFRFVSSCLRG